MQYGHARATAWSRHPPTQHAPLQHSQQSSGPGGSTGAAGTPGASAGLPAAPRHRQQQPSCSQGPHLVKQRLQLGLNKHLLPIEKVDIRVRHLAVHQQQHARLVRMMRGEREQAGQVRVPRGADQAVETWHGKMQGEEVQKWQWGDEAAPARPPGGGAGAARGACAARPRRARSRAGQARRGCCCALMEVHAAGLGQLATNERCVVGPHACMQLQSHASLSNPKLQKSKRKRHPKLVQCKQQRPQQPCSG